MSIIVCEDLGLNAREDLLAVNTHEDLPVPVPVNTEEHLLITDPDPSHSHLHAPSENFDVMMILGRR